ncbi:transposable element Tc1 transposase [Trichonephila clavipes]|nr:transposable element Tc1 transposase [Trichonephila clavipes]
MNSGSDSALELRTQQVSVRSDSQSDGWNRADWGLTVFNNESRFQLCLYEDVSGDDQASVPILLSLLHAPKALNQKLCSGVPFSFDSRTPLVVIRSTLIAERSSGMSPIQHVWNMMRRRLHLPGNVDDLAQQVEKNYEEIPQETASVLYHSWPRRVAACIQARGESTPY